MDDLLIDDDALFDADAKLSRAHRLVSEVQCAIDLPDVDYDTWHEVSAILTLIKRVKAKIPATMAAA